MQTWLDTTIRALNLVETMEQPNGFTRLSFSKEELEAQDVFKELATSLGMTVRTDAIGNVIARLEGRNSGPAYAYGSHLDTVTNGGGYDGAAGILTALGAVKLLKDRDQTLEYPLEVICFVSEESSRFSMSTVGSKAMAGMLTEEQLETMVDQDGVTLGDAIDEAGYDPAAFREAERDADELRSFVELHIEQGMRIENAGKEYGVARAIACPIRLKLTIKGRAGHTGTTPMNQRQDALPEASELILFVQKQANALNESADYPLVATVSTIESYPNAMNVIPGEVVLGIDIRSVSDALKEQMEAAIDRFISDSSFDIDKQVLVRNPSVTLDATICDKLMKLENETGYTCLPMESGAGHDVMNMQTKWPSGLLFIPCKDGLSHHPNEHASLQDLEKGTELLYHYMITAGR
ncbi:M20 family metallo-hydrolase [Paenalkalicoccus suaedae]|uniref:M20 family metallo-hydrolase n=1 Tax=Paenalkalicoccus suaedae TaxID=2592382 RepID=A0A859FK43_9BACI|nr:M20 family metallo-hydrolase [Paenalkalicoccus suaedae]QKS73172.1 M20 family metallo-hydrolase [Paenalkalicoccus suaedae]